MADFLTVFRQFFNLFKKMTPAQRMSILLVFFSTGVVIVGLSLWLSQPDYAVLYANLDMAEAGVIKQKLDEMKIPVKVKGSVIMVPSKSVYEARIALASEGLPQGSGVGYEIFDKKSGLGMTDYLQQINYKRALEGEIARSISTIKGIKKARVHIVLPKPGLFEEEKTPASASVVLGMSGMNGLTKDQLQGIVHLVSSSVEGLTIDNITVVDTYGNLLYGGEASSAAGLTDSQLDVKRSVERYLEKKASSMLAGILGPGKAIVRINADIDFMRVEKTQESYDPESLAPRSEDSSTEISPGEAGASGKKEHTITNYEISKTIAHIIEATGNIKKLTIAVVVNGQYDDEQKKKFRNLVAQAVGLDSDRGDTISINDIEFDTSFYEEEKKSASKQEMMSIGIQIAKYAGLLILAIIAILTLQSMVKSLGSALPKPPAPVQPQTAKRAERTISDIVADDYDAAADVVREYLEGKGE